MEQDISAINLILYQKEPGRYRETKETLSPRVTLIRKEQLYHKRYSSSYVIVVMVEKYIDQTKVNAWSWMEEASTNDVLDFPTDPTRAADRNISQEDSDYSPEELTRLKEEAKKARKRLAAKLYYQRNKEKITQRAKEYMKKHPEVARETKKKYRQKIKEKKLWEDQLKDSSL